MKGPDLLAGHDHRPYICLSDETHSFSDEEALYTVATTTRRSVAISLSEADFETGGLPREIYVNPWTILPIRHADIILQEGRFTSTTAETIAREAAGYLGVR